MAFRPKRLTYDNLRTEADRFLTEYHPDLNLPIPIEETVEFDFEIELIPLEGLQDDYKVDGFITSDLKAIYVDQFVMEHRPRRFRFTLAHELAHYWLHDRLFQGTRISNVREWQRMQEAMPEEDFRFFEWQANSLAGLILVPPNQLKDHFDMTVADARERGLSDEVLFSEVGKPFVLDELSDVFEASNQVVEIRLDKDELWDFPEPPRSPR